MRQLDQLHHRAGIGMRDPDHQLGALADELGRALDELLAICERQIVVFAGLDAGDRHHGDTAVVADVVDLALQRLPVDRQVRLLERRQRCNDQAWEFHGGVPSTSCAVIRCWEVRLAYGWPDRRQYEKD